MCAIHLNELRQLQLRSDQTGVSVFGFIVQYKYSETDKLFSRLPGIPWKTLESSIKEPLKKS